MKHWDLKPGEDVTLQSDDGRVLTGYFEFRDTIRGRFLVENDEGDLRPTVFKLTEGGDLRSGRGSRPYQRWTIKGPERHTRHVMQAEPEEEHDRRMKRARSVHRVTRARAVGV